MKTIIIILTITILLCIASLNNLHNQVKDIERRIYNIEEMTIE